MLLLGKSFSPETVISAMKRARVKTIIQVHNVNSYTLMGELALRMIKNPTAVIGLVCSSDEGWAGLRVLAAECGHSVQEFTVVDPNNN